MIDHAHKKIFEDLITNKTELVKMIDKVLEVCDICELLGHATCNCPALSPFNEVLNEQAHSFNTVLQSTNNSYS